jgi:hypothetical protein
MEGKDCELMEKQVQELQERIDRYSPILAHAIQQKVKKTFKEKPKAVHLKIVK